MSLRDEITADLITIESELGTPTFQWKGGTYNFIPSISEFDRELETGGFSTNQLLTATIRKLSSTLTPIFSTYPTAQEIVIYNMDNSQFRIQSIKHDPTGAFFRIIAVSTVRGI